MGTYEESDGAVAAKFAAAITVNPPADFDPDAGKRSVGAKAKYEDPKTSGLEFEVTEDGDNHFEIKLERGK